MKTHNYVQEAWEERFQIRRRPLSGNRFAIGFAMGAVMTGAMFYWFGAATAGYIGL